MRVLTLVVALGFCGMFWTGIFFLIFEYPDQVSKTVQKAILGEVTSEKECKSEILECRIPTGVKHTAKYKIQVKQCPLECV